MAGERFRITIDVDEALYRRVYKAFEWGDRNKVMLNHYCPVKVG